MHFRYQRRGYGVGLAFLAGDSSAFPKGKRSSIVCPPKTSFKGESDPNGHCFTMVQKVDPSAAIWSPPRQ
jgi:hypothetical protein